MRCWRLPTSSEERHLPWISSFRHPARRAGGGIVLVTAGRGLRLTRWSGGSRESVQCVHVCPEGGSGTGKVFLEGQGRDRSDLASDRPGRARLNAGGPGARSVIAWPVWRTQATPGLFEVWATSDEVFEVSHRPSESIYESVLSTDEVLWSPTSSLLSPKIAPRENHPAERALYIEPKSGLIGGPNRAPCHILFEERCYDLSIRVGAT